MATRFYLPTTAADVTPAANAAWDVTGSGSPTLLPRAKTDTAMADFTVSYTSAADADLCLVRAVSAPLGAQTISGTVKMQFECSESTVNANFVDCLEIYVVSNDGSSVVGTLLAKGSYGPGTEMNLSKRNKKFADGDAISSLAISEGDRLVVAFGARMTGGSGTRIMTGRMGDATAIGDAAENEVTTADKCGWIEFSGTIALAPTPLSVSGGITPTGALARQTGKALAGAIAPAGAMVRSVGKALAGAITPTGATAKLIARTFAGAVAPAGAVLKLVAITLVGSILVTGSLVKMAGKALAGVVAPAGALVKTTAKLLGGIVEPIGTITKRSAMTFAGVVAPIGSLVKLVAKLFGGGVTPSGALEHSEFSTMFVPVVATVEERSRVRMTEIREDNAGTLVIEERERVMLAVEEED